MDPLVVYGTRPEIIKLFPVIDAMRRRRMAFNTVFVRQHVELAAPFVDLFEYPEPFKVVDIPNDGFRLPEVLASVACGIHGCCRELRPSVLVVQGDTSTAFSAALGAHYAGVAVLHVEAGLRTLNVREPWPEEAHRRMISVLSSYHCAPTPRAKERLLQENVALERVWVTGNTVVDALCWMSSKLKVPAVQERLRRRYSFCEKGPLLLFTGHRRENIESGYLLVLCSTLRDLARDHPDIHIVWPAHLNPAVRQAVEQSNIDSLHNFHVLEPMPYDSFIWLMSEASLVVTDSGGVVEEATTLRVPVITTRNVTDRQEAVQSGAALLLSDPVALRDTIESFFAGRGRLQWRFDGNLFGDGHAGDRVVDVVVSATFHESALQPSPRRADMKRTKERNSQEEIGQPARL